MIGGNEDFRIDGAFRFPAPTKSFMDYYTLVTPEFVAKPIYTELQEFTGNE